MDPRLEGKLTEGQVDALAQYHNVNNKRKNGRPPKEFGPLLKIAAIVLHEAGLSKNDIAAELKVSVPTVDKVLVDDTIKIDTEDMDKVRTQFKGEIAGLVQKMILAANSGAYIERLAAVKNPGLITAISQMVNIMQNLDGKPSSIVETRDAAADIAKKLKEIEDLEAALKQGIVKGDTPKAN